jgi:hypothetical protein
MTETTKLSIFNAIRSKAFNYKSDQDVASSLYTLDRIMKPKSLRLYPRGADPSTIWDILSLTNEYITRVARSIFDARHRDDEYREQLVEALEFDRKKELEKLSVPLNTLSLNRLTKEFKIKSAKPSFFKSTYPYDLKADAAVRNADYCIHECLELFDSLHQAILDLHVDSIPSFRATNRVKMGHLSIILNAVDFWSDQVDLIKIYERVKKSVARTNEVEKKVATTSCMLSIGDSKGSIDKIKIV